MSWVFMEKHTAQTDGPTAACSIFWQHFLDYSRDGLLWGSSVKLEWKRSGADECCVLRTHAAPLL